MPSILDGLDKKKILEEVPEQYREQAANEIESFGKLLEGAGPEEVVELISAKVKSALDQLNNLKTTKGSKR